MDREGLINSHVVAMQALLLPNVNYNLKLMNELNSVNLHTHYSTL